MDKSKHPKVVRTWLVEKIGKVGWIKKRAAPTHKPAPHNKT
jgi:hypothetical protein